MIYHIAKLRLTAAILIAASSSASAQHVLFEDDFSNGISQWTVSSPWQLAPSHDACTAMSNPPASYGAMARMGDADCTFNSICPSYMTCNAAHLTPNSSILIPSDAVNPRLEFDSFIDSEACVLDFHDVRLFVNGSWIWLEPDCIRDSWHRVSLDLSPWVGQPINFQFFFYAWDNNLNDGLGWLIDNVVVSSDCASQRYCIAAANSVSTTGAIIGHTGSLSLAQNDSALTLQDGPPGEFAVFFYGSSQTLFPISQGILCVAADASGYHRLLPGAQIDANGAINYSVDVTSLTGPSTILPGIQVNFQCWYRDTVSGVSTSNFSDGLAVTFCP